MYSTSIAWSFVGNVPQIEGSYPQGSTSSAADGVCLHSGLYRLQLDSYNTCQQVKCGYLSALMCFGVCLTSQTCSPN